MLYLLWPCYTYYDLKGQPLLAATRAQREELLCRRVQPTVLQGHLVRGRVGVRGRVRVRVRVRVRSRARVGVGVRG